jgi:hypothetical protein
MPMGKEAFGDLFFYGRQDGTLAIAVGLEEWLSPGERDLLLSALRKEYPFDLSFCQID